jgi:hypothetical protein
MYDRTCGRRASGSRRRGGPKGDWFPSNAKNVPPQLGVRHYEYLYSYRRTGTVYGTFGFGMQRLSSGKAYGCTYYSYYYYLVLKDGVGYFLIRTRLGKVPHPETKQYGWDDY